MGNICSCATQQQQLPPPGAPVDKKWYHHGITHEEAKRGLRSTSTSISSDDYYADDVVAPSRIEYAYEYQTQRGTGMSGRQKYTTWDHPVQRPQPNFSRASLRVPPPGAPVDKKWYHRRISHEEAEYRLRNISSKNGVYLVYDNPRSRGNYILLAIYNGDCVRWDINRKRDGTYILGRDGPRVRSHESVRELIKYHRGVFGEPIKMQHGGTLKLSDYVYEADSE